MLDQVRSMKQQGYNDSQIVTTLQDQGSSPREINEAMAQANIKDAVSNPINGSEASQRNTYGMQQSLGGGEQEENQEQTPQVQQPNQYQRNIQEGPHAQELIREMPQPPQMSDVPQPGQPMQEYPEENFYPEEQPLSGEYGGGYNQGYDDYASQDNVTEVASQMIAEKTKDLTKKMTAFAEMGTLLTAKVEKMDERLTRIESIFDQLQTSLLRKANQQEQNIVDVKSEMEAMQDSFGKVINPLVSTVRKKAPRKKTTKRKTTKRKTTKRKTKRKKKK
jgi:hypothetical protein